MGFEVLCNESDIPLNSMRSFEVKKEKVIIFHLTDGFFATQSKCPHMFAPLEKGTIIDDCKIQCKLHRAEFNIKTGKAELWANFPPGIQTLNFIRGEKDLKTFAVQVLNGEISIDINQPCMLINNQTSAEKKVEDEPA